MPKLLSATDLLPKSEAAIDRAGLLAQELSADLTLMHVASPVASARALEQSLEMAHARMKARSRSPLWFAGPQPEVVVRAGSPARAILDTMADVQPDLMILGPHEKRGAADALQGTLTEKVVAARLCPVLVVQRNGRHPYRHVVLALDTTDKSRAALRGAERLVLNRSTQATVVHASPPPHVLLQDLSGPQVGSHVDCLHATEAMHELLEEESTNPLRYGLIVADRQPIPAIRNALQALKPDLLVLGTQGDGRLRRALLGSVANQILKIATCDVLIVPHTDEASTATASARRDFVRANARGRFGTAVHAGKLRRRGSTSL